MKYMKMLGLAAIAAAALMAFAGAGTASAETTLCADAGGSSCYGTGTKINTNLKSGTEAVLTGFGSFGETKCKKSQVDGKIETATTPSGKVSTLEFKECNNTVKVIKNGELTAHHDAEGNATLTSSGYEVEVTAGVTCVFGGSITSGLTLKAGSSPVVEATASLSKVGGSIFCPSTGQWHATYTVIEPTPSFAVTGV